MPMPFFNRSCKTASTSVCPRCDAQDKLQNTVNSLKAALHQHSHHAQERLPQLKQLVHHRPQVSASHAALCTIGLAAIAGAAVYASRNPRIPEGVHPVEGFELNRYLGKWYELARIDHSFEKGLQRTQAEYSLLPNGAVQVINRGFDPKRGEWKVSHGKAKPTIAPDVAALKVSFFGPFYSGYNVVALDDDYQWAMVIGSKLDYFWILSRKPSLPDGVEDRLMHQARRIGVDTQKVLWVHQDGVNPTGSYK
ncbi:MAG: lipocalin family protein [Comamonas sp.]